MLPLKWLHDNSTVINDSFGKGLINAEADIEHIWNFFVPTIGIFNVHTVKQRLFSHGH